MTMVPSRLEILRRALARVRKAASAPERLVVEAMALAVDRPRAELFHLRAAASNEEGCFEWPCQSGEWKVGFCPGLSKEDRATKTGRVLLRVTSEFLYAYEGRRARVFVSAPEGDRILAEGAIMDGVLCAETSIAGLDLSGRGAINVLFLP